MSEGKTPQTSIAAREPLPEACACESCQDAAWPQTKGHDAAQDHGVQDGHTSSAVPGDAPGSAGSGGPRSATTRQEKPRSWMYAVEVDYLVNVCEAAFDLFDAADANPIPLTSPTAMAWHDLKLALDALDRA